MAQHCTEGMGEEKLYFPFWKSAKHQKAPLGRSVSTNFVTDCSLQVLQWVSNTFNWPARYCLRKIFLQVLSTIQVKLWALNKDPSHRDQENLNPDFDGQPKLINKIKLLLSGMLHSALLLVFIFFQLIEVFGIEVEKSIWKFAIILIGLTTLI